MSTIQTSTRPSLTVPCPNNVIDPLNPDCKPLLEKLQGDILKHHVWWRKSENIVVEKAKTPIRLRRAFKEMLNLVQDWFKRIFIY